jgi:hypothetical protein
VPCTGTRSMVLVLVLCAAPLHAASDAEQEVPVSAALGIKAGAIPPVLLAPELVLHAPHVFLGTFGMATGDGVTLGAELGAEFSQAGQNTPYVLGTYFHFASNANATGGRESIDALTLTAGYEWIWKHVELQVGAGALFLVNDEVAPCTGWFCGFRPPPVLPTVEISLRYRFF